MFYSERGTNNLRFGRSIPISASEDDDDDAGMTDGVNCFAKLYLESHSNESTLQNDFSLDKEEKLNDLVHFYPPPKFSDKKWFTPLHGFSVKRHIC